MSDTIARFNFTNLPVRGQFIRLTRSWLAATEQQNYDAAIRRSVGEAMALAALLADGIKFEGRVALQATSDGTISTLLGECSQQHLIRGIAQLRAPSEAEGSTADRVTGVTTEAPRLGKVRLAISLIPDKGEMHQGVVELIGDTIGVAVEHYFAHSEQLPTRIQIASDDDTITAMLLQRLPKTSPLPSGEVLDSAFIDQEWERLDVLFSTNTDVELLSLEAEQLLYRLFNEDDIRLTPPRQIDFGCSCSRERSEAALKLLGKEDLTELSNQTDEIEINCEMCGQMYTWDSVEAHVLFESQEPRIH